ncbi:RNA-binding domain-containing protein [Aureobasidium subglaciale]|nr:RNA-binding domain-containing protein [Aureobasidium subglaciale]KAI5218524.1 RNA-binding domain-containing protein [Aureobasidium subglaciale]KAI5222143.1 RNA-binding domain-containing protein [Aureobasidium subglaciale]KAI5259644.1 RNA-binding domain-containing protein [Aureobasidium subglaciale]
MASKAAPPTGARPNHTLYCSNLPDKLQKDDLKRALYMLFSVYGSILDIVAMKTNKMRGQAHVLFRDVSSSTQAMRSLQGFEFFGKEMVRPLSAFSNLNVSLTLLKKITYSSTKSDTLAKLDGTYKQPPPAETPAAAQPNSLQQSIFSGAPGASTAPGATAPLAPPPALDSTVSAPGQTAGVKRPRDESDDDKEEEAPMDMDDEAMEESDDE